MSQGWAGPVWGEPSAASTTAVPLRSPVTAGDAAYRADGGRGKHFWVMAASVAGTAHRLAGRRCDDAFGWAEMGDGTLVVAVADGVSGAARGGEGAQLAVATALAHAREGRASQAQELCIAAVGAANEALASAAGGLCCAPGDLSTTLLVAVLVRGGSAVKVPIATVGDSAAFTLSGGEWCQVTPGAGVGEGPYEALRPNVTVAIPATSGAGAGRTVTAEGELSIGDVLVLLTDGVADALRDGPTTVAPSLAATLSGPVGGLAPIDLARAADFSRRGCHDDRTILAVWPVEV